MAASRREALAPRQATYQDVLDAPAHLVAEIINGTLHTHPRPAPAHGEASAGLASELLPAFGRGRGGPGGWRIHFEPELHLADDVLVPDLAGFGASPARGASSRRAARGNVHVPAFLVEDALSCGSVLHLLNGDYAHSERIDTLSERRVVGLGSHDAALAGLVSEMLEVPGSGAKLESGCRQREEGGECRAGSSQRMLGSVLVAHM